MKEITDFLLAHASDLVSASATLIGAFSGAWFAFRLQKSYERRKQITDNASSVNVVHLQLFQYYNNLLQLSKDLKSPFPNDPIYWINIPSLSPRDHFSEVNISGLGFFVQSGNPNLVAKILLAREKYNELIKGLNARSEMHLNQLQPILERNGVSHGTVEPVAFLSEIGIRLNEGLKNLTDGVLAALPPAIQFFEDLSLEIYGESKRKIPGQKFFHFTTPEKLEKSEKSGNLKK